MSIAGIDMTTSLDILRVPVNISMASSISALVARLAVECITLVLLGLIDLVIFNAPIYISRTISTYNYIITNIPLNVNNSGIV